MNKDKKGYAGGGAVRDDDGTKATGYKKLTPGRRQQGRSRGMGAAKRGGKFTSTQ